MYIEPILKSDFASSKLGKELSSSECSYVDVINKFDVHSFMFELDSFLFRQKPIKYSEFYEKFEVWNSDDNLLISITENIK